MDGDVEDVVELGSHDGCFYHFRNYSLWPRSGANVSFSTSQLSESTFSHHARHDVVNNQSGVMKMIRARGNVDRTQRLAVILTS